MQRYTFFRKLQKKFSNTPSPLRSLPDLSPARNRCCVEVSPTSSRSGDGGGTEGGRRKCLFSTFFYHFHFYFYIFLYFCIFV